MLETFSAVLFDDKTVPPKAEYIVSSAGFQVTWFASNQDVNKRFAASWSPGGLSCRYGSFESACCGVGGECNIRTAYRKLMQIRDESLIERVR